MVTEVADDARTGEGHDRALDAPAALARALRKQDGSRRDEDVAEGAGREAAARPREEGGHAGTPEGLKLSAEHLNSSDFD